MKNGYLLSVICLTTFAAHSSYAQENKSIDQKGIAGSSVKHKASIFISGGNASASGKMKDSLFIGNGWNIEGGGYIPLFYSGGSHLTTHYFTAGIEAGITYTQQKANGGISSYTNSFRLQDGTINPVPEGSSPRAGSLQILAGPKAEWGLGRISVSPSVLLGYLSFNRKGYTLSNTISNPKQTSEHKYIPFLTTTDYSASGFVIKPRIELGYHFTTAFSLFATGSIAFGPTMQNNIVYWKPQGNGSTDNIYSYDQFTNGATKTVTFNGRWQIPSVNMGLRYTWIKGTFDKGHGGRKQRTVITEPAGAGNNQPQNITKADTTRRPSGAVSSSYAAGKMVQPTDSSKSMPSRLSMTPTTTRQTQGSNFGEKVSVGMQTGGNAAQMVAGNPIPGIVVKGGKNPPGLIVTVISDNNGAVFLNNLQTGTYLFKLSIPDQPAAKNIDQKDIKSSDNVALPAPGQPIKGVIVKGGKNPGGNFTNLTVKENGEIGFEVLEAGDYKLIIETPGNNNAPAKKEKVKEKATSGLKDVIKTNV